VGKKIFLPLNFLAEKEVSYSPFHSLARWRSVAPDLLDAPMRESTLFKLVLAIARPYLPDTLKRAPRTRQRRTTRYSMSHSPKGVLLLTSPCLLA
jgi:hypothetical protein